MEVPNLISFNLITLAFNHCRHGPYWQFDAPALPVVHLERVRRGREGRSKEEAVSPSSICQKQPAANQHMLELVTVI